MDGFFDMDEVVTTSTDFLCSNCGLDRNCKSPRMKPSGTGDLKTLIISESPGAEEDYLNKQLIGDEGQYLRKLLKKHGLSLDYDFWKTDAITCYLGERYDKEPTSNEIVCCHPHIEKFIRDNKPEFIWLFGKSAIESYLGSRFSDLSPARWRGLCIPDYETGAWVIPMFPLSYVYKNKENTLVTSQFERDLVFAINCLRNKGSIYDLPRPDLDKVRVLTNHQDIVDCLQNLLANPPKMLFFDYETTGLKPYKTGHKIASVSFITDESEYAYSFPLQHLCWTSLERQQLEKLWSKVLKMKSKKIAQNAKFEDVWSRVILKTEPSNWHWDTMIASHIIDNRKKYTGLKFQSFIRWGVPNYDKEIKPYLESTDEAGFNRVLEAPLNKLLLYGGIDSLVTKWLYNAQVKEIDSHLEKGIDLFTDGTLALADVQMNGINCDTDYYQNCHTELSNRIKDMEKNLSNFDECKEFEEVKGRLPNLGSSTDLREMFFDILKFKSSKQTDKKNASVDKEAMSKIDSPLAKEITELGRIKKIDGTYIQQFLREIDPDGRLHPFFNIGQIVTYRSSSAGPNFQNIPVRNEEAKKYARTGIIPSKGFQILDFDYAAIEVRIGACYTQDPVLVSYIKDPSTDMHRDTAADIFCLPTNKVTKDLRFYTKNGFIFPEWYGSYYKNCAINIWSSCSNLKTGDDITVLEHLKSKGIIKSLKPVEDFIKHVQKIESKYWKKFKVFKEWQENWYKDYEKRGYIELLSGFRCSGYMGRNELINYGFQGTAFHCLLYSLTEINAELKARDFQSKVIGQVHDCCIIDTHPSEKEEVIKLATEISTERIREHWEWITVPLEIEWEQTEVDQTWYLKKEIK